MLEVALPEAVHLDLAAQLRTQLVPERRQERGLGHPAGLQLEQRVRAVALPDLAHRLAQRVERNPGGVLKGGERIQQRRGQDAAEVADHSAHLAHRPRARTYTPAPSR